MVSFHPYTHFKAYHTANARHMQIISEVNEDFTRYENKMHV